MKLYHVTINHRGIRTDGYFVWARDPCIAIRKALAKSGDLGAPFISAYGSAEIVGKHKESVLRKCKDEVIQ